MMLRYGAVRRLEWRGKTSERYYVRVYKHNGAGSPVVRTWKSTGFADRECAEAVVHRWQLEALAPPEAEESPPITLGEAVKRWYAAASLGHRPNYIRILRRLMVAWEAWRGDRPCRAITEADILERIKELVEAGRQAATLNLELTCWRMFWRWAIDQGIIERMPLSRGVHLPVVRRAPRAVNAAEEERLLAAAAGIGPHAFGYVLCLLESGFRSGMAARVRWEHVDLAARLWRIPAKLMKSGEAYTAPIAPTLMPWLEVYARKAGRIFGSYVGRFWDRIRRAAGLPDLRRHDLRRTYVTRSRRAGVPMEVAMRLSDHRDVRTMLQVYRAVDLDDARKAMELMFGGGK